MDEAPGSIGSEEQNSESDAGPLGPRGLEYFDGSAALGADIPVHPGVIRRMTSSSCENAFPESGIMLLMLTALPCCKIRRYYSGRLALTPWSDGRYLPYGCVPWIRVATVWHMARYPRSIHPK